MSETKVLMPQMGESISEGTLTKWHKKVGEKVEREEVLFEISTDKVDTEIPSPVAGVLTQQLAKEGDVVKVNSVVAIVDDAATASATPAKAAQAAPSPASVAPSPAAAAPSEAPKQHVAPGLGDLQGDRDRILSSPLVRKMAAEHNVDLRGVTGTGESGRITKNDIMAHLSSGNVPKIVASAAAAVSSAPRPSSQASSLVDAMGGQEGVVDGVRVSRVPMTSMRKKIAEHMVMSKRTSPHVTSIIEVDLQKVVDLRQKFKDKFEAQHGFKLSFMPFFMAAALEGIKAVPGVNSSVEGDTIVYKRDVNLGIAVALDWGLIVPVIKHAQDLNVAGLGRNLNDLAEKARNKKLAPDDVKGGTFSISNFGGFGTLIGQPIINQPQVAIMGIGAMVKKPVVINDAIAIRTCCYVVLTFDHRILDGADSGKFLSTVKATLENWSAPVL